LIKTYTLTGLLYGEKHCRMEEAPSFRAGRLSGGIQMAIPKLK